MARRRLEPGTQGGHIPLPAGLSDPRSTARAVFDGIAALYDRARPSYPTRAVSELLDVCGVDGSSRILEIGCGTGQLTRHLAPTGAAIRCVEPGSALADIARANLAGFPNVDIATTTFEELEVSPRSYDVVVSATAFHWIDPSISFAKAADVLEPGGFLALMTNAHASGGSHTDERIAQPVRDLHRRIAPEVGDWTFATAEEIRRNAEAGGDIAAVWSRVDRRFSESPEVSSSFGSPMVKTYPWIVTYDRDPYLEMLATQSSYALMEPAQREELLSGIGGLIDEVLGGMVTKQYVAVLAVAQKTTASRGGNDGEVE
ncbi:MAG: class I SAM-dependent methyltransferase [Acidimicrobiales bacterium]